jgi:hypothetical protein
MNEVEIRQEIRKRATGRTLSDVARDVHVSVQYLHDVVKGRRKPGRKLLKGMGLVKRVEYVKEARV